MDNSTYQDPLCSLQWEVDEGVAAGVKVDSREDGGSVTVETAGSTEKLLTAVVLAGLHLPSGYFTLPASELFTQFTWM